MELIIIFVVFMFSLNSFLGLGHQAAENARADRNLFNAVLDSKNYVLLVDSFHNNTFQGKPKSVNFDCQKLDGRVACRQNEETVSGALNNSGLLSALSSEELNDHYR